MNNLEKLLLKKGTEAKIDLHFMFFGGVCVNGIDNNIPRIMQDYFQSLPVKLWIEKYSITTDQKINKNMMKYLIKKYNDIIDLNKDKLTKLLFNENLEDRKTRSDITNKNLRTERIINNLYNFKNFKFNEDNKLVAYIDGKEVIFPGYIQKNYKKFINRELVDVAEIENIALLIAQRIAKKLNNLKNKVNTLENFIFS